MIRVRRVEDVAIVDWSHKDVATVVPRIRALVDSREAKHVLLNMTEVETLKGEGLETLTEALSVCEDGGCGIGMYALNTYLSKLLDIMNLYEVMPTIVGAAEAEALAKVRALGSRKPAGAHARPGAPALADAPTADGEDDVEKVELDFEPQDQPVGAKDGTKDDGVVEFEFDAPEQKKPAAPASKKAAPPPSPAHAALSAPTIKFDKAAVAGPMSEEPDDLLGVAWADIVAQGVVLGGPGARDLMARALADANASGAAQAVGAQQAADTLAAQRPTKKIAPPSAGAPAELEIEIDDIPARPAAAAPVKPREFKTEVIHAFEIKDDPKPAPTAARRPKIEESSDDTESLQVDFDPVKEDSSVERATDEQGGRSATPEWSPVDEGPTAPPPGIAHAPPAHAPAARAQTPPGPLPARPAPTPAQPARPVTPPHPQPLPGVAAQAQRAPTARLGPPTATPPAPARPATPVQGTPTQPPHAPQIGHAVPGHAVASPGQPIPPVAPPRAVAPVGTPPPVAPQPAAPAPKFAGGFDAGDETVMFQPDGLLAEVLAAVSTPTEPAPAAAPPAVAPPVAGPPPVAAPAPAAPVPSASVPSVAGGTTFEIGDEETESPVAAPVAAAPAAPAVKVDPHEELKQFLRDHAIVSELHLRVLERFSREGLEKVLARTDVQSGVGGSAGAVSSIIEDFVQGRLLKRRRSPRVRGGTGFLYSPSPKTRSAVVRIMRLYEDGATRAEVLTWIQAAARASA